MLKHVGKMKHNGAKVCVVYRTLPGEAYSALVVGTSTLSEQYHNALMKEVESLQGQEVNELGELLNNRYFPDGTNMLHQMHLTGRLVKVPSDGVIMTPNSTSEIPLDQLNLMIAEQKNVAVDDLAITGDTPKNPTKIQEVEIKDISNAEKDPLAIEILDHKDTDKKTEVIFEDPDQNKSARDYRSEADRLYKEAARLRKMADDLDPPKKKAASGTKTDKAPQ